MKRRQMTLEQKDAWVGRTFILPWIIGFIFLFAVPMLKSLMYSFQEVQFRVGGIVGEWVGWQNYYDAFRTDPDFVRNLTSVFGSLLYEVAVITIFSLFIAMILNMPFKGRTFARALFFLPVIVASGIVINILKSTGMDTTGAMAAGAAEAEQASYLFQSDGIAAMLKEAGLNSGVVELISSVVSRIFDITWKSGIQILLFLGGLQTIPASYYEASDIEGATAWESFWKITFPLISPITVVVMVYTVIDSFTSMDNSVMRMIDRYKTDKLHYSSALAWIYFILVLIVVGIVIGIINRKTQYIEE